jgi:hypothetical protein
VVSHTSTQGWKKPFFFKPAQWDFFVFFWFSLGGFWAFFVFLGFLKNIVAQKREFLGFFQFQEYF